jgi:hypothetical protein
MEVLLPIGWTDGENRSLLGNSTIARYGYRAILEGPSIVSDMPTPHGCATLIATSTQNDIRPLIGAELSAEKTTGFQREEKCRLDLFDQFLVRDGFEHCIYWRGKGRRGTLKCSLHRTRTLPWKQVSHQSRVDLLVLCTCVACTCDVQEVHAQQLQRSRPQQSRPNRLPPNLVKVVSFICEMT